MIINNYIWPLVIVSLPDVKTLDIHINKHHYTMPVVDCQLNQNKSTMEYNYITTEEYIQSIILEHQDIIP